MLAPGSHRLEKKYMAAVFIARLWYIYRARKFLFAIAPQPIGVISHQLVLEYESFSRDFGQKKKHASSALLEKDRFICSLTFTLAHAIALDKIIVIISINNILKIIIHINILIILSNNNDSKIHTIV